MNNLLLTYDEAHRLLNLICDYEGFGIYYDNTKLKEKLIAVLDMMKESK
jgi:hypothetical protein